MPDEAFDPWREWLGVAPDEQPADHYRLLGLAPFEDRAEQIERAADERMARVRGFQTGPRSAATEAVLNRLAAARQCLLNPATKASYDAVLEGQFAARDAAVTKRKPTSAPPRELLSAPPELFDGQLADGGDRSSSAAARRRRRPKTRPIVAASILLTLATAAAAAWKFRSAWWPDSGAGPTKADNAAPEQAPEPPRPAGGRSAAQDPANIIRCTADAAMLAPDVEPERKQGDVLDLTVRDGRVEAAWDVTVRKPGYYMVAVTYWAFGGEASQVFEVEMSPGARVSAAIRDTGQANFATDDIKVLFLPRTGQYHLTLRTAGGVNPARTIRVREVVLRPEYLPKARPRRD